MPRLTFKFGVMAAAKSLDLLVTCFQFETAGKRPCVLKPQTDTRQPGLIRSRVPGMQRQVDLEVKEGDQLDLALLASYDIVLVDECQWLTRALVQQLQVLSLRVPVVCYGLRTDFRRRLFPGSEALFELADEIVEVRGLCRFCDQAAAHNLRVSARPPPADGSNFEPGADEAFVPACKVCFQKYPLL